MVRTTAERDFKGVWIPKEVWLDKRLSMLDKGILTEIDSLDMGENGCFASNEHLAEFCQCSLTKVSTSISKLIEFGYVSVVSFDGRKRFLKSRLSKSERQTFKNCEADFQKVKDSNTSIRPLNKPDISISSIDDDFSKFWAAYPRKDGKTDALKAWKSLKPNADLQRVILNDIRRRMESGGAWYRTEKRFIKLPASYLRGRRWEDEGGVTEVAEHREPDPIVLTDEERAEIDRIYAQNGRDAFM